MTNETPGAPVPGWYRDPSNPSRLRFWDGAAWTDQLRDAPAPPPPPAMPVPAPMPPPRFATMSQVSQAYVTGPTGTPYASLWRRFAGLVIDNILFFPLTLIILGPQLWSGMSKVFQCASDPAIADNQALMQKCAENAIDLTGLTMAALIASAVQVIYFVVCLSLWGRTLGGQLVGIRCVTDVGSHPSWGQSTIRSIIPLGFSLLGALPVIGFVAGIAQIIAYLSMLWSPRRQTLMDQAAKTFVVRHKN